MKIGVSTVINSNSMDVAELARQAEELGFDSFWLPEHPIIPAQTTSRYGGTPDGSIPPFMADMADPFIGLAMASAHTARIRLGTAVCLGPGTQPVGAGQADRRPGPPFRRAVHLWRRRRLAAGGN